VGRVDLYLGSDLGLWALDQIEGERVGQVLTEDREIVEACQQLGLTVHCGNPNLVEFIPTEVAFSIQFRTILRPPLLSRYRHAFNLHPGYLPWGRGTYPIFWALWEGTPAGATVHEMTDKVDRGAIVRQLRVEYGDADTGFSLFQKVRAAQRQLFLELWPRIAAGDFPPATPQPQGGGTYHSKREFFALKEKADLSTMTAADLVRLARCLSFPGYSGLVVRQGGRQWELSLSERDPAGPPAADA